MKVIKRLLLWFTILFILFFVAASFYIKAYGKGLVEEALNAALKRDVVLGEASYHFPLGFRAQDVRIAQSTGGGDFLEAQSVIIQLAPEAIYQRRLVFDSVIFTKPSIVIKDVKKPEEESQEQARRYGMVVPPVQPEISSDQGSSPVVRSSRDKNGQTEVTIKRFVIKQGRLQYVNGLTEKGFSFNLEDVQLKAKQLAFPSAPGRSEFSVSARLVKEGTPLSGSNVEGHGWVDVMKRAMEARVEVVEENGIVGLTAKAVAKDNDMNVTGEIRMHNLLRGVSKQASSDASTVNDLVLNALSSAGVEIGAQFSFKTKMDDFQVGQVSFSGNVVTK